MDSRISEDALRKHEREQERIVKQLLERFEISAKYKRRMLSESNSRLGYRVLTLNLFFQFFPTFPARLVLEYPYNLQQTFNASILFKSFRRSQLVTVYDSRFQNYVEPSTADIPRELRFLPGFATQRPLTIFGAIFRSNFSSLPTIVVHNHPVDVAVPGTRLLWINNAGRQLAVERLEVFLDTVDKAAGGEGWQAEPSPEFA
jgi:hypothetical protein